MRANYTYRFMSNLKGNAGFSAFVLSMPKSNNRETETEPYRFSECDSAPVPAKDLGVNVAGCNVSVYFSAGGNEDAFNDAIGLLTVAAAKSANLR